MKKTIIVVFILIFVFTFSASITLAGGGQVTGGSAQGLAAQQCLNFGICPYGPQ